MEDYKKLIEDCTHYIKDENTNSWDVIEVSDLEEIMQAYHESKVKNLGLFSVSNRFINDSDLDTIKELRDLMEDVINGNYKPDSFTNQPINNLIERLENGC